MLKEELFINELDGRQLKRIYVDEIEKDDDRIHYIKDMYSNKMYAEVIVLPNVSISNYREIIVRE